MSEWAWARHVFSIELRKLFTYRVTFWLNFIVGTLAELTVSYWLWSALFESRGATQMEGYSFHGLLYYALFASLTGRIVRGVEARFISVEIYEGTLNRYLLYPLPFLGYKYVTHLAQQLIAMLQLVFTAALLIGWLGLPQDQNLTFANFALGGVTCLASGYLYFTIAGTLEMVAFWQDTVWNLMAMLRFITHLLGGALIPLAFFPDWARKTLELLPFAQLISFPVRTLLGRVTPEEWLTSMAVTLAWAAVMSFVARTVWRRGTKIYAGVGV